jgi:hypothetical protein
MSACITLLPDTLQYTPLPDRFRFLKRYTRSIIPIPIDRGCPKDSQSRILFETRCLTSIVCPTGHRAQLVGIRSKPYRPRSTGPFQVKPISISVSAAFVLVVLVRSSQDGLGFIDQWDRSLGAESIIVRSVCFLLFPSCITITAIVRIRVGPTPSSTFLCISLAPGSRIFLTRSKSPKEALAHCRLFVATKSCRVDMYHLRLRRRRR